MRTLLSAALLFVGLGSGAVLGALYASVYWQERQRDEIMVERARVWEMAERECRRGPAGRL